MNKISWNENWNCCKSGSEEKFFPVSIPHDAMRFEKRSADSPGGVNTGWVDAGDYTYAKRFFVPKEWENMHSILEFEGVYHKACVWLNGEKAAEQHNGYLGFYVPMKDLLRYGEENEIRVTAVNSDQPNSRWYTGTGIYRPVWLYLLPPQHIVLQGIKITTLALCPPRIRVQVKTTGSGPVKIEIQDEDRIMTIAEGVSDGEYEQEILLPKAECWDTEHPKLYTCRVHYQEDMREERFGIRMISLEKGKGFCLNGTRTILKGACIHHDNGILGACAWDYAERRKIELLKRNGYNAVRSAHNPCSKALLDACDELGMVMVDEYADAWYIHKTKHDYASAVEKNYQEDLKKIVDKDFNHPSVIMYSTGNEVSETAQKRGIGLCQAMTECLHELDNTRPVTCGVNIFFNFLSSMGFGVYSDRKAEKEADHTGRKKAVGSEFFNELAGLLGSDFMKWGATLPPCDRKTRDAYEAMDVAGYNYGIRRYAHDLKKYPQRWILGTETFCSDAFQFWQQAKKNQRLIGDFVWAGMDYLGEVGLGAWEYEEYAPDFSHGAGWTAAGSGRLDLTGKATAEMKYTRVAFGLDKIGIGVVPVPFTRKKHSPSAWRMSNAIESWSWNGCDGMLAEVEVYADADHIALYVNTTCVGTKSPKNDCKVVFHTTYHDGEIRAVASDAKGQIIAEQILRTAGEKTVLMLEPESGEVRYDGGLCYVRLKLADEEGTVKPLERSEITVSAEGGEILGTGSACPYTERSYTGPVTDTYYGEALAIIRPQKKGKMTIHAFSRYGEAETEIEVV